MNIATRGKERPSLSCRVATNKNNGMLDALKIYMKGRDNSVISGVWPNHSKRKANSSEISPKTTPISTATYKPARKIRPISTSFCWPLACEIKELTTPKPPTAILDTKNACELAKPAAPRAVAPKKRPTRILSVTPIKITPSWAMTIGKLNRMVSMISRR